MPGINKGEMKRVLNILIVIFLLLVMACSQEPEKIVFNGPNFVFLDSNKTLQVYENAKDPITIPVSVSMAQPGNTDVTYEIISEGMVEGSDFTVQSPNPISIPAGQYSVPLVITLTNNNIIQPEERMITVKIKSVNSDQLNIDVVKEVSLGVLDDDCDPTVAKVNIWIGDLSITDDNYGSGTGTGSGGAGGICGGSLTVTGYFFNTGNPSSTMVIKFLQSSPGSTSGLVSVARFQVFQSITNYEYEASGTYNEVTKKIVLNYTVFNTSDNSSFTGTQTITAN